MALTTYEFYRDTYYGDAVAQADFPKWLSRAEDELMFLTNGNIENATTTVNIQKAVCALIDAKYKINEAIKRADSIGGAVKSMSSGGESITYTENGSGSAIQNAIKSEQGIKTYELEVIKKYLNGTGLLYWGL